MSTGPGTRSWYVWSNKGENFGGTSVAWFPSFEEAENFAKFLNQRGGNFYTVVTRVTTGV